MKIILQKKFEKHYWKCTEVVRTRIDETLVKFRANPIDPVLRNHALQGNMKHKRAISVTGDIRIIFEEHESYTIVIMLDVGTHNQVY